MIQLQQGESVTNWSNKQTLEKKVLSCYLGFAFDLLHELGTSHWSRTAKQAGEFVSQTFPTSLAEIQLQKRANSHPPKHRSY